MEVNRLQQHQGIPADGRHRTMNTPLMTQPVACLCSSRPESCPGCMTAPACTDAGARTSGRNRLQMSSSPQGICTTLFCLLLLSCEQSCAGRLFEWVDNNGATHFSDRAPRGLPFAEKTIRSSSGTAQPGNESGIRNAERILLKNARRHDSEIARARQSAAQQFEERKSRCRQARARYHETIHRPGSAGNSDFRTHRRKMNEACD